jgi:hypothetical protein
MPWRHTSYHRYYYLDRDKLFFPTLAMICFLVMALGLTLWFFMDPNWYPHWPRGRIRGKGAFWVLMIFLLISLPVWLRVPIALSSFAELIIYRIAMLVWMFDSRPDFAIGPEGIYGIDYLSYRHISWRMIDRLDIKTFSNRFSSQTSSQLVFVGKTWDEHYPKEAENLRAPKIVVRPYFGVDDQEILELARKYNPRLLMNRIEVKN